MLFCDNEKKRKKDKKPLDLQELLLELGLCQPSHVNRNNPREPFLPQKIMYQYLMGVLRIDYMRVNKIPFSVYAAEYWELLGTDRIMHIYTQMQI